MPRDEIALLSGLALATTEYTSIADAMLIRNISNVEDTAPEYSIATLVMAGLYSSVAGTTRTINKTDGSTMHTQTITKDASAEPITGVS